MKKRFDPHAVATRIVPQLAHLKLSYANGQWRTFEYGHHQRFTKADFEALISRVLRDTLDEMGDTERPVTSALVRETTLALASLTPTTASWLIGGKR